MTQTNKKANKFLGRLGLCVIIVVMGCMGSPNYVTSWSSGIGLMLGLILGGFWFLQNGI
jgi:hypothetical protein